MVAVKVLVAQARETEAHEIASGGGGGGWVEPLGLTPDQPPGAGSPLPPPPGAPSSSCRPPGWVGGEWELGIREASGPHVSSEIKTVTVHRLLRVRPHSQHPGPEDLRWCLEGNSCPFPQAHFQQGAVHSPMATRPLTHCLRNPPLPQEGSWGQVSSQPLGGGPCVRCLIPLSIYFILWRRPS